MAEETETKMEALPDLDDLLQCPVCYEIPAGQIFQCNEGHHVCGRCKMRLDVCPVCRALFFGTRNYAMEELIANVRKLRAFKLGGKVTTLTTSTAASDSNSPPTDEAVSETEDNPEDEDNNHNFASRPAFRAPQACKGLFRCLCCKNGNAERLPAARLLNHLRYYHAPELIEGSTENGEYLQAWQFSTEPGRIVTAVRVADMGVFFLIIEINADSVYAWLTMASSPWVAHEFCYTVTISGNDREAIFSDCVWSVRSCEGSLKKRGHCLLVNGSDARALVAPASISGKLSIRRVPTDQVTNQTQPRAVLRVANRGSVRDATRAPVAQDLEPFLQDLQNDVARLSRAFVRLGREANALVRAEVQSRNDNNNRSNQSAAVERPVVPPSRPVPPPSHPVPPSPSRPVPPPSSRPVPPPVAPPVAPLPHIQENEHVHLSRNARRRMRQRVRAALNASQSPQERTTSAPTQNAAPLRPNPPSAQRQNGPTSNASMPTFFSGFAIVQPETPPTQPPSGPSNGLPNNENQTRASKKKRRHRR
ncbi:uncharacterized protein LOC113232942 [Hyposmocoma kahamanoa]|uniref:uncharacterized protein LOC113232942 n=1 Tax=Hyposmocoma kahamanoa TaxID=1477025 RepID=UPI000E6D76B2|nr:uncharacterized protein LOC113232942 [Hyposmocoma kahamanoa]